MTVTAQQVIEFWFGELTDGFADAAIERRWWVGGEAFDREIEQRFGEQVAQALEGQLDHWAQTPEGLLALVLILDQFTRNIYRGSARAFAGDVMAQQLASQAVEKGWDKQLAATERCFLYMPFEHAEDLAKQLQCVALFDGLIEDYPQHQHQQKLKGSLDFAHKHLAVIEQFGRFPHRNQVLGRVDSVEEAEFLQTASRWGQ